MSKLNLYPADILLPKTDFEKWSVIACDQYTSEPEYWAETEKITQDCKSALNIVLPEVYLTGDNKEKISEINKNMEDYLASDIFNEYKNSYIYVERVQSDGKIRHGLIGCIDLEDYDYSKNTKALIRATEATVLERIPPRVKIREDALLELPHVMLLVDDSENILLSGLEKNKNTYNKLYDFDLMQKAGHITGWNVASDDFETINTSLSELSEKSNGLLFCVGDGNHSLATAKECYTKAPNALNRYALVEVVNIHDTALEFEPIYRLVFGCNPEIIIKAFVDFCGGEFDGDNAQKFVCVTADGDKTISVKPQADLSVGTLQKFLDTYILKHSEVKIDYIHGEDSLRKLSVKDDCVGFLFDGMKKSELFPAVIADGSLPRKTFSMGHADDKRFYLEARKIK